MDKKFEKQECKQETDELQCERNLSDKKATRTENIEGNIGKNLFAIIASMLIFIGFGIFVLTVYGQSSETINIIAFYAFGFTMVGAGLCLYLKNKNNFCIGIAGCGMAELFCLIIALHTHFEIISLSAAFSLVFAWIIGIFALIKIKPVLFKTIGYIGFIASIILGLNSLEGKDGLTFIFLFWTFVGANFIFVLTHKKLSVLNLIFMHIGLLLLPLFATRDYYILFNRDWGLQPIYMDMKVYALSVIIGFNLIHLLRYKQYKASYSIFSGLSFVVTMCYLFYRETNIVYPAMTVILTGLWVLNIVKCGANGKNLFYEVIAMSAYWLLTLLSLFADDTIFLMIVIIPIVTFTLIYMKTHDYASGFMSLLLFICLFATNLPALLLPTICFIFSCSLLMLTREEEKWGLVIKNGWYLWMLCSIMAFFYTMWQQISFEFIYSIQNYETVKAISDSASVLTFVTIATINLCRILKTAYVKNVGFKKSPESIFLYVVNGIMIGFGLNMLGPNNMELLPTFLMIVTILILLFVTLLQPLNTKWKQQYLTLIHFVKLVFYVWFLMVTFGLNMILIDIAIFILAIIAIVIGFKLRSKPTRIYGLVLSLLSSISIVLFGVFFDSIQTATGIVICGVLCFVISFIYAKASTKMENCEK